MPLPDEACGNDPMMDGVVNYFHVSLFEWAARQRIRLHGLPVAPAAGPSAPGTPPARYVLSARGKTPNSARMSSTPRKSAELFVEPLEQRIAPTGLVAITNPDPTSSIGKGDPRYIDYNTAPADGRPGFVAGSTYGVNQADIYAIKLTGDGSVDPNTGLSNGDKLVIFNAVQGFNFANPFIQSANGSLVAFFRDANGDHVVQNNELIGISVSKGSAINVNGTVNGDIVANFGPHLNDGAGAIINGALKIKQSIAGINVVGNVTGNVIAGGSIDSVAISGNVGSILAGTAGNGVPFFFGDPGVVSARPTSTCPR